MSIFEEVLSRASKSRRTGPATALISCPAAGHDDKHPSVTVRETADGAVMLKCRSQGCSFADMVAGLGLEQHQFFPPRPMSFDAYRPQKRQTPAGDILSALADELLLAYIVMADFEAHVQSNGELPRPSAADLARFLEATARVRKGAEEATGSDFTQHDLEEIREASRLTEREEADLDYWHSHTSTELLKTNKNKKEEVHA